MPLNLEPFSYNAHPSLPYNTLVEAHVGIVQSFTEHCWQKTSRMHLLAVLLRGHVLAVRPARALFRATVASDSLVLGEPCESTTEILQVLAL